MLACDRSAKQHYGDDQGRYWSVSQVCEVVSGGCQYYAHGSDERGEDLHVIFSLAVGHSVGWCSPPDVPQEYLGYYDGMRRWIDEARPSPSYLECMRKHAKLGYAGKMDFVGSIRDELGVLDLKTGVPQKWHAVQVEAYKQLVDRAAKKWILYVRKDGTFKQVPVKAAPKDWAVFQNGLSILNWRGA